MYLKTSPNSKNRILIKRLYSYTDWYLFILLHKLCGMAKKPHGFISDSSRGQMSKVSFIGVNYGMSAEVPGKNLSSYVASPSTCKHALTCICIDAIPAFVVTLGFSPSTQFSRSVLSDSLQPHESQHARPPCPSPTPGVHSDSHPSSQ